ncbi:hypothetical protein K3727_05790 [Rhodobacteraceae bacterium M382]|nr:hypothetical protein K3727_05790 [Rhodobacteraceae bacterium M382]
MTPENIERLFTGRDGSYRFARWGRPIAPIAFGVEEQTLGVVKGALEALVGMAGHELTDMDPELGSNLMFFFFRDWDELLDVPDLGRLIPGLGPLVDRLKAADASQYRAFRFDDHGAIQAAFVFLRMTGPLAEMPAETLALTQAVQVLLVWGDAAFSESSPLAILPDSGATVLRPDIANVIVAAYDPIMPSVAQDKSHALRLFARVQAAQSGGD